MCEVFDPTPMAIFGIFSTYFAILGIVGWWGMVGMVKLAYVIILDCNNPVTIRPLNTSDCNNSVTILEAKYLI